MNRNTLDNKSLYLAYVVIIIAMIIKFIRLLPPSHRALSFNFLPIEKLHAAVHSKAVDALLTRLKAMKVINFDTHQC